MCCTGAASSWVQMASSIASRCARSSLITLILISSWVFRLAAISFNTASLSPALPTITTGLRAWARALRSRRSDTVRDNIMAFLNKARIVNDEAFPDQKKPVKETQDQQAMDARACQRSFCAIGEEGGLSFARRLQAAGDRCQGPSAQARHGSGGPGGDAGGLGAGGGCQSRARRGGDSSGSVAAGAAGGGG